MNLYDYLQLIFALSASLGSLFCCIGASTMNNKAVALMTMASWGSNKHAVKNLVEQRSQYVVGGLLFTASFLLFVISVLFQDQFKNQEIPYAFYVKSATVFASLVLGVIAYKATNLMAASAAKKIQDLGPALEKELMEQSRLAAEKAAQANS